MHTIKYSIHKQNQEPSARRTLCIYLRLASGLKYYVTLMGRYIFISRGKVNDIKFMNIINYRVFERKNPFIFTFIMS